jgi:hypothetical protein
MKKIILIVFACLSMNSCASIIASSLGMKQEDSAYKIVPRNIGENRAVAVFYSSEYLKEKEDKRAENAMREPNYKNIPEFVYIQIRIQGWTPDTANPSGWLFIVQDKNKNEIYRDFGESSRPKRSKSIWWNLHNIYLNIYLKSNEDFPLFLRIITPLYEVIEIIIQKK